MGCILRVVGSDLDVDALTESLRIIPYRIDRKGERCRPRSEIDFDVHDKSGLHFRVGGSRRGDLGEQVDVAMSYLRTNSDAIRQLMTFAGVESGTLDFKVDWEEYAMQCDYLPPHLLRLAGSLNLGIEVSHYVLLSDEGEPTADDA
jgi:hypothetical protein